MGGAALAEAEARRRGSSVAGEDALNNRRASGVRNGYSKHPSSVSPRLGMPRRPSEQLAREENGRRSSESFYDNGRASPIPSHVCSTSTKPPSFSRKASEHLNLERRGSYSDATHSSMQRQRESSLSRRGKHICDTKISRMNIPFRIRSGLRAAPRVLRVQQLAEAGIKLWRRIGEEGILGAEDVRGH